MSKSPYKTRATNLKRAAQDVLGLPIKLSQAYELLAREEGYANWDTASAAVSSQINQAAVETGSRITVSRSRSDRAAVGFSSVGVIDTSSNWLDMNPLGERQENPGLIVFSGNSCGEQELHHVYLRICVLVKKNSRSSALTRATVIDGEATSFLLMQIIQ